MVFLTSDPSAVAVCESPAPCDCLLTALTAVARSHRPAAARTPLSPPPQQAVSMAAPVPCRPAEASTVHAPADSTATHAKTMSLPVSAIQNATAREPTASRSKRDELYHSRWVQRSEAKRYRELCGRMKARLFALAGVLLNVFGFHSFVLLGSLFVLEVFVQLVEASRDETRNGQSKERSVQRKLECSGGRAAAGVCKSAQSHTHTPSVHPRPASAPITHPTDRRMVC